MLKWQRPGFSLVGSGGPARTWPLTPVAAATLTLNVFFLTFIIPCFLKIPLSPGNESCKAWVCRFWEVSHAVILQLAFPFSVVLEPPLCGVAGSCCLPRLRLHLLRLSLRSTLEHRGARSLAVTNGPPGGALGPRDTRLVPFPPCPPLTPAGRGVKARVASVRLPSDP